MEEIKKCPFCGGNANLYRNFYNCNYRKKGSYFVYVKCKICGAQGKIFHFPEWFEISKENDESMWNEVPCRDAVEAWNRRADVGGS